MVTIRKETTDFVHACEAIHALLGEGLLAPDDQDLIEHSSAELLSMLSLMRPAAQGIVQESRNGPPVPPDRGGPRY